MGVRPVDRRVSEQLTQVSQDLLDHRELLASVRVVLLLPIVALLLVVPPPLTV